MKKLFLLIGLVSILIPTYLKADSSDDENKKYDPSQTIVIESNEDYVILENKSAIIQTTSKYTSRKELTRKFGDDVARECEKNGNKTFFKNSDGRSSGIDLEFYKVLSNHKGKFFCLPELEIVTLILNDQIMGYEENCNPPKDNLEDLCNHMENWISENKFRLRELAQPQNAIDPQQKKIETCEAYNFEKGSEPFAQCIFKLMELDLEYAKLENEKLRLEAEAKQAKLNNQVALSQSLAAQAQASNRDKALRIQQFGLAMQGIANSFQTPSSMANPKITCNKFGTQMKCW